LRPRTLVLVAQIKVAEAGELHLLPPDSAATDFLEEQIHQLTRFTLVSRAG